MPRSGKSIAKLMATYSINRIEQVRQTEYRVKLADFWQISEGCRILEIGCGQGDMTAVILDRTGPSGYVLALDAGVPEYGEPVTVGDSMAHLQSGPLGSTLEVRWFDYNRDIIPNDFDAVVFAHSSWYFDSYDQLLEELRFAAQKSNTLLFAEWLDEPNTMPQVKHGFVAKCLSLIYASGHHVGNVCSSFSYETLLKALEETGWEIAEEAQFEIPDLSDAKWEYAALLEFLDTEIKQVEKAYREDIINMARLSEEISPTISPLPTIAFRANRKRA